MPIVVPLSTEFQRLDEAAQQEQSVPVTALEPELPDTRYWQEGIYSQPPAWDNVDSRLNTLLKPPEAREQIQAGRNLPRIPDNEVVHRLQTSPYGLDNIVTNPAAMDEAIKLEQILATDDAVRANKYTVQMIKDDPVFSLAQGSLLLNLLGQELQTRQELEIQEWRYIRGEDTRPTKLGALGHGLLQGARRFSQSMAGWVRSTHIDPWASAWASTFARDTESRQALAGQMGLPLPDDLALQEAYLIKGMRERGWQSLQDTPFVFQTDPSLDRKYELAGGFHKLLYDLSSNALPSVGSVVVGALVGGGMPGAIAATSTMGSYIFGDAYNRFRDAGIEPGRALQAAYLEAGLTSAMEFVGFQSLFRFWKPASGVGHFWRDAVLIEAATEYGQTYAEALAEEYAYGRLSGDVLQDIGRMVDIYSTGEFQQEALYAGFLGGIMGGMIGGGGKVAQRVSGRLQKNIPAEITEKQLDKMVQDGALGESVFVDAGQLQALYQDGGDSGQILLDNLGLAPSDVDAMAMNGGTVELPAPKMAYLKDHDLAIGFSPEEVGMMRAERDEGAAMDSQLTQTQPEDIQQRAIEVQQRRAAIEDSIDRRNNISSAIQTATNYTKSQADSYALLIEARARTWAGNALGRDVNGWYARHGMEFRRATWVEGAQDEGLAQAAMYKSPKTDVKNFVQDIYAGKQEKSAYFLYGQASSHIKSLANVLNIDMANTSLVLPSDSVRHVKRRHANDISAQEWEQLPVLLEQTEEISMLDETRNHYMGKPLAFMKYDGANSFAVLTEFAENAKGQRRLYITSYLKDNESAIKNYLNDREYLRGSLSAGGSPAYPSSPNEQNVTQVNPLDNNITQTGENGNNGGETFEQNNRGSITFNDSKTIISFFQAHDITTAGHEIYHLFRRDMEMSAMAEDATTQEKADWAAMCEFVGTVPGQGWTEAQEEKLAKAGEVYISQGKAPSPELAGAFARLAGWFVELWRNLRSRPGIKISPQMRGVFDRMLASEEQIAVSQAKISNDLALLVDEFSPEEYAEYSLLQEKAADAARRAGDKRRADIEEKIKGVWQEEASNMVDSQPVYKALNLASEKGMSLGVAQPEDFGEAVLALQYLHNITLSDNGASVYQMAQDLGYVDAATMISQMAYAAPREAAIEQEIKNIQQQWEATWPADWELQSTKESLDLVGFELQILSRMSGTALPPLTDMQRTIDRQTGVTPLARLDNDYAALKDVIRKESRVAAGAVKAMRREAIATREAQMEIRVNEATHRQQLLERAKAAKEKQFAALSKLRSTYQTKESRAKLLRRVERVIKSSQDIEFGWGEQMRALANRFGLSSRKPQRMDELQDLNEFLTNYEQSFSSMPMAAPVAEWVRGGQPNSGQYEPRKNSSQTMWRNLRLDEFEDLVDAITFLAHQGQTSQILLSAEQTTKTADVINDSIAAMQVLPDKSMMTDYQEQTLMGRVRQGLAQYSAWITNPERILDTLDGNRLVGKSMDTSGPLYKAIREQLIKAQRNEVALLKNAREKLDAIFKPLAGINWQKRFAINGVPLPDAVNRRWGGQPWNMNRVMAVALNMGNQGNIAALMNGYDWTYADVDAILEYMTEPMWRAVQQVWDLLDEQFLGADEVYYKQTGLKMKRVEPQVIITKYGEIKGGYFPIVRDPFFSKRTKQQQTEDYINDNYNSFAAPKTKDGFTKARKGGTNEPLMLSMNLIYDHLQTIIRYQAAGLAIRDADMIINSRAWKEAAVAKVGQAQYDQIRPWLKSIARPEIPPQDFIEKFSHKIGTLATIQGLGLRFSSALIQLTSIPQSAALVGWGNMASAYAKFLQSPIETRKAVMELSPIMRERIRSVYQEIRQMADEFSTIKGRKTITINGKQYTFTRQEFESFCFSMIGALDATVSIPTWLAAYDRKMRYGASMEEAGIYADNVVDRAQGSGNTINRSAAQRMRGAPRLLFGLFLTFPITAINQIKMHTQAMTSGQMSKLDYASWAFNYVLMTSMIETILRSLLSTGDLPEPEDYFWGLSGYVLGGLPFLRQAHSLAEFGSRPGADMRGVDPFVRMGRDVKRILTGKGKDDSWYNIFKNVAQGFGFWMGVPTDQFFITAEGIKQLANDETDNPFAWISRQK